MFSDFHKAALAKDGYSPDTGKYYADFIDMESFALKWWMEEFSKNYDAYASSQFYYKDVDSVSDKIFAGPVWDYDLSLGNMYADNFVYGTMPDRDYVVTHSTKQDNLYRALYQHEDFREILTQMYRERVRPAIAEMLGLTDDGENQVLQTFDGYMDAMDASAQMNFTRWPESLVSGYYKKSGQTHAQSATYLKNYMLKRLTYLDSVWLEKEN